MNDILYTNGSYRTPDRKPSLFARTFPGLKFYYHLLSVVVRGSSKAKRGKYKTAEWCASSLETLRALESVGVRMEIDGVDNFATLGSPCIFIGNHMSTLETFVLPKIISSFRESTFVVKQSLVDYPIFKHIMRTRNPITVGRTNPREDLKAVFEGGEERLKAGVSLVIFPQTTRTAVFDPAEFNTIGIKLAKRANVPVVPVALLTDAWGNGKRLKDFGRIDPSKLVHFSFGKPIWIKDRGTEEHQQIIDFITDKLRAWGGQIAGQ